LIRLTLNILVFVSYNIKRKVFENVTRGRSGF
jgi:hypothetical protein